MKRQTLTQSMAWLHTWGGLIFGWMLFAIFLTGTLAVFDKELDHWMQPEVARGDVSQSEAAQVGLDYLQRTAADASAWNIGLPTERSPGLRVSSGEGRRGAGQDLDPQTGEPLSARETLGGQFFFHFHYTLHLPRMFGIWVVGLAAMAMLAALVSGIVIHKKFFKEFFTFRPAKGQRSWLDAHNASAVLVLPFHLMITYTGLVIMYLLYMPAAVDALYGGDTQALFREIRPQLVAQAPQGQGQQRQGERSPSADGARPPRGEGERAKPAAAALQPIGRFIEQAEAHYGKGMLGSLSISNPGRAGAQVSVSPLLGSRMELTKGERMLFDGVSGKLLQAPPASRPSVLTQRVMSGLHFAQFGGYPMRWLYFLCGLASCAMIASGVVLFTVKRRRKYAAEAPLGRALYRLVEGLNLATIGGLALACVGLLWANRLLPVELSGRSGWELSAFFGIWLASLLHGLVRPYLQAWREQLWLAALLCAALPLLDALSAAPLHDLARGDRMRVGVDLVGLALGLLLAYCAWRVGRPAPLPTARRSAAAKSAAEVA
jgi:uncharacterized iron-regulated membrane protein